MKYSERFFKFPVRIYKREDFEKMMKIIDKIIEENIDLDYEEPNYILGFEYCIPEEIIQVSPSIGIKHNIESNQPCNRSEITLSNGRSFSCNWSPEKFLEKLDDFVEKRGIKIQTFITNQLIQQWNWRN